MFFKTRIVFSDILAIISNTIIAIFYSRLLCWSGSTVEVIICSKTAYQMFH